MDASVTKNLEAADKALKLTPQERELYMRHLTNLWTDNGVDNSDGSRSTLYATTIEKDGKAYVIPTVRDGKILPVDQAVKAAEAEGLQHFPSYANSDEAEARYNDLHGHMERDTSDWEAVRRGPIDPAPNVGLINGGGGG